MLKLIFLVGCLLEPTRAAFLQECEGVIINRIPNPNPECSEYVHCNGDDSYYCNGDCTEPASCYGANETTASTSGTVASETSTTISQTAAAATTTATTATISSSSRSSTRISTTATTSTTLSDNLYVICRNSGRNGVYPYPANSNYFYQCLAGYLLLHKCPQNFEFVEARGQCIGPKY